MQQDLESKVRAVVESALSSRIEEIQHDLTSRLRDECGAIVQAQLEEHGTEFAREAQHRTAENLAQGVHRIRSEDSVTGIAVALVETAAGFAGRCALFIHKSKRLLGFRMAGGGEERSSFESVEVPLADAAALAHAIETRDAVVTGGNPGDLSPDIVGLFGLTADDRAHLFPIVLRDKVLAVLYADGGKAGDEVERAAIEILTSVAEAWLEAVGTRKKPVYEPQEATV